MINITTRAPAAIKYDKFVGCTLALSELSKILHDILHRYHVQTLKSPSPTYWIQLHALDIEEGTGTIDLILIKSQHHLNQVSVQYRIEEQVVQFFDEESPAYMNWDKLVAQLLSKIQ